MTSETVDPRFWALRYVGGDFHGVDEPDLATRDIVDELENRQPGSAWIPPPHQIIGRGAWPDWIAFPVPLLSARALAHLQQLLLPHCEVLPWFAADGHSYSLLHVLSRIPRDSWSCEESSVHGDVIASAEGISIQQRTIPHIFELEGLPYRTFVSDTLAKHSHAGDLSGALFVDPAVRSMKLALMPQQSAMRSGFIRQKVEP